MAHPRSSQPPSILFIAEAAPDIGGGHVMRSLTLARALGARGAAWAFLDTPPVAPLLDVFAPEARRTQSVEGAELIVVDGYGADADGDQRLAATGALVVAIDDLADRPRDVAALIDPSFGRDPSVYADLLPTDALLLLGPAHALVRDEFTQAQASALATRDGRPVGRVLVSLGLTDLGGVTAEVLDALSGQLEGMELDVVLGLTAPSLPRLQALTRPGLHLHVASRRMASLMAGADLAIGAGGGSAWERACLGLPTITVVLADNQRPMAQAMQAAGLTLAVERDAPDFPEQLRRAWRRLAGDGALRAAMARRLVRLCDGRGAERTADALLRLSAERRGA